MTDDAPNLFTWASFAYGVRDLLKQFKADDITITHIVAVPRGGLCLGVALSHALSVPLHIAHTPEPWMPTTTLAVDDMTITGDTLAPFARAGMPCAVLVKHPNAPAVSPFYFGWESDEEYVFPWEAEAAKEPYELHQIVL